MKKILLYIMMLGALGILSSCSSNETNTVMNEDATNKKDTELNSSQTNNEREERIVEDSTKFGGNKRIILKGDLGKNGTKSMDTIYDINEDGSVQVDHFRIDGADSGTFEPIFQAYSKDKNYIYYSMWRSSADVNTFQHLSGAYGKDKNGVYYAGVKIIGADPATFLVQENGYAKDKNTIFFKGENVKNANKGASEKEIAPAKKTNIFVFGSDEAIASGQVIQPLQKVGPGEEVLTPSNGLPIGYAMDVAEDGRIIYPIKYTDTDGVVNIVNCGYKGCFEEKFTQCSPARIDADTGLFGAVEYNILGKKASGCSVSFKYTKYSDPDWVDKEMICEVNNKIGFQEAWSKVFENVTNGTLKCTGPLYTILHPQT